MPETIGFVGLGIMGAGMVKNLATKGHAVSVWNRTESKAEELAKSLKIKQTKTLRDLAASSSVLMLCVTNTGDVEQVVDEAASSLKKDSLVIDCSTISPKATEDIAAKLRKIGIGYVDAPVSGGSEGAALGTLAVMAGGMEEDFNRAKPILEAIGTRITHMGPAGKGQVTKLLNQILVVVNMLAVSEALLFGRAAELDLKKAVAAVESGAAGSWMLSKRAPQVLDNYWKPGFTVDLQQKDVDLVLEYAGELGLPLLATGMIRQLYARLQKEGKGGLGNHALIQALEPLMPAVPASRQK
ncbi:NAD(P)-dependent oxidoreductase [Alloacidobacterium sp.]|uniref:NAD(P)-dependent oxidoreductase n=1 Tax=Alloacidobacterium sp. TaxID=2951999 RepID=UPI002D5F3C1F|nr:NAD(P)-dependent oxidoreductase [Alloacidobacterium sp.]HYK36055.1 NAD(P)-dependent oxidoreductase [Alloacidobacterium sp.]